MRKKIYTFLQNKSLPSWLLLGLLMVSFFARMYHLSLPKTYYFDEVYHAVTAKLYARNDPAGYEWWHEPPEPNTAIEWLHPPIAKLIQAGSIYIFGENSFGWRFASVVFGVGVIWITYLFTFQLTKVPWIALLSAFFAAFDGLLFVQSRIAMNDIFVVFFMLCALYFSWKWRENLGNKWLLLLSGLFIGLSISTKWSGIFLLPIVFIDQMILWISKKRLPPLTTCIRIFFAWIIVPSLIYLLSFSQFWLQGHTWNQFVELHNQIWYYQTHLKATHSYQSVPWQWFLDLRPVWMYVDYLQDGTVANIYNIGNPVIFWVGIPALIWILFKLVKTRKWMYGFLFLSYISVWLPWACSPRIMFFYHYAPAVPLLCIILAILVHAIYKKAKYVAYTITALALIWFVIFYPNLIGVPVSQQFANRVYFVIPSWR